MRASFYLTSPNTSPSPVCVRMALWCAPSFPARCMSPGAHGAPAQLPVATATGWGHVSARTQRVVLPVLTPSSQRAVIYHRVQVWHGTNTHMNNWDCLIFRTHLTYRKFMWYCVTVFRLCPSRLSPVGCLLSEWSPWSECSTTCGGGLSMRNKTVLREPEPGGTACVGPLDQHTVCSTNSCLPGNTQSHSTFMYYISTSSILLLLYWKWLSSNSFKVKWVMSLKGMTSDVTESVCSEDKHVCVLKYVWDMMSFIVCSLVLQSVPVGRCLVTVQVLVHTSVRTCGHTLSVYLDPAPLGALALLDRYEHLRSRVWENYI